MKKLKCKKCGSGDIIKGGPTALRRIDGQKPRKPKPPAQHNCNNCGYSWPYEAE